ncbi:MAG: hypothetical protein HOE99_10880, partial [Acidiferrobacteraceae bacterium]|nr:hypothetical protein [Acidiferrobacteraceae bacterium]
ALDCDEGDRIAAAMGEHSILMMANHGVAVSGTSVALAFNDLYYLERAAMFQVLARSTGRPFRVIPDEIVARTRRQVDKELPKLAQRHFTALKRMLDRQEPDYRN